MTLRYVGPGGNDGDSGLTWALRKLTLNGVEDTPVVAGDVVWVGPGVYREQLTLDVSGGNPYSAGSVSVTNGSKIVTGAGTAFLANVTVGGFFHVRLFASNNDGVANGTATFTSAGGTFHANMIGMVIQINARGAYLIGAVAAANSITLTDPNGLGWPGAGAGLTYSVMSGQGHYEIESVDNNTQLTLVDPWCGITLTGLSYITFDAISYIGDVSGENTDGVGGIVRITGSDNDQTTARSYTILGSRSYRLFRGFMIDSTSHTLLRIQGGQAHIIIEDFVSQATGAGYRFDSSATSVTFRRCNFQYIGKGNHHILFLGSVDDTGHVLENLAYAGSGFSGVYIDGSGGITVRNWTCTNLMTNGVNIAGAITVGQSIVVNNSIFAGMHNGLNATALGEITEDYNTFSGNDTDRTNTATGANSQTYFPLLQPPLLLEGYKYPWWYSELSEWSSLRSIAGFLEACKDLRGIPRPVTSSKKSWGATQFFDMERETGTVRTGSVSMAIRDAGRHQIWVPVTATSTTISVYVYREANYAGNLPQMIIKQPGQADDVTTDVGAAGGWNLLTTTLVPAALPPYVVVELVSRNTNGAADEVFFDDLDVS